MYLTTIRCSSSQVIFILQSLILFAARIAADIDVLSPDNKSVELFIDYKITYTPAIPENGIIGFLVRAEPSDACSRIAPPIDKTENWFVLADRSSSYHIRCSNREKIQHAAEAGYKAIILYSPYENYFQSSMTYYSLDHSNTSVPAVLVSHEDGEALKNRYLYKSGYKIYITSDIPPNLSYYLLPFAIVIGVCLLLTISFMIFQLIRCVQERRKAQRHRLSKKYLKKLPCQKFVKDGLFMNAGNYYETCAICLDDYVDGEKIRILPCNHAYHSKCIDPWLTKNRRVCPVCKAKVTLPGMPESDDSDADEQDRRTRSSHDTSNERTHLLPSGSGGRSGSGSNSNSSRSGERLSRNNRNLDPFTRWLMEAQINAETRRYPQPNYNSTSSTTTTPANTTSDNARSFHALLDDTLMQPGPSSSAPVISELSRASNHNGGGSSSKSRSGAKSKRKRSGHNRSGEQVVAAEITPLIGPPILSINGDSDIEPNSARRDTIDGSSNEFANVTIQTAIANSSSSSSRPSKQRPSVDHIV